MINITRAMYVRRPKCTLMLTLCVGLSVVLSVVLWTKTFTDSTIQMDAMSPYSPDHQPREITVNKLNKCIDDVPWMTQHGGLGQSEVLRYFKDGVRRFTRNESSLDEFKARGVTPIYIVEEHHQVIPYWFGAAESGLLPDGPRATLVHIDAHSDLGSPTITPTYPVYRWPSRWEWTKLMTENDEFIVASILVGMFSRLIWVYPDWDADFKSDPLFYSDHMIVTITGGVEIPDPSHNRKPNKDLPCACAELLNWPYDLSHKRSKFLNEFPCVSLHNRTEDREEMPIPRSKCRLLNRTLRVEIIKESKMLEMMKKGDPAFLPIHPADSLVLDIDEDFFGVEPAVVPLYKANMGDDRIDTISVWITQLFCSKSGEDELAADSVFQKLIHYVRHGTDNPACQDLRNVMKKMERVDYDTSDIFEYPKMLVPLFRKQMLCAREVLKGDTVVTYSNGKTERFEVFPKSREVMCPHVTLQDRETYLGTVIALLYRLSDRQLKGLAKVGICMWSIQLKDDDENKYKMRICDGFNRPNNESAVTFFLPTIKEIEQRGADLRKILQGLSEAIPTSMPSSPDSKSAVVTPSLVTVCRSARDGYTPRSMMPHIESLVIKAVKDVFSPARHVKEIYNPDLVGGIPGWWKRQVLWSS